MTDTLCAITAIVVQHLDAGLTWSNAKLSVYRDVVLDSAGKRLYGVELQTDMVPPANYVLIDHHNICNGNITAAGKKHHTRRRRSIYSFKRPCPCTSWHYRLYKTLSVAIDSSVACY